MKNVGASAETRTHTEARDQGCPGAHTRAERNILAKAHSNNRDERPAPDAENPPGRGKRKKADGGRAKRKPNEALEMLHEPVRELGQDRSTDE